MKKAYLFLIPLVLSFTIYSCKKKSEPTPEPCMGCEGMPFGFIMKYSKSGFLKDHGLEFNKYGYSDFEFYTIDEQGKKEVYEYKFQDQMGSDKKHLAFTEDPDLVQYVFLDDLVDKGPSRLYMVTNADVDTLDLELQKENSYGGYRAINLSLNGKPYADTLFNPIEIYRK